MRRFPLRSSTCGCRLRLSSNKTLGILAFLLLVLPATFTGAQTAQGFYTLTPCRVLDTRAATGPYGGPALNANSSRTFVFSGRCGIPATAGAVAVNVTVTGATSDGSLRIYPGGSTAPMSSSINYRAGMTRANGGTYGLGSNGDLVTRCDQPSGNVQVVVDVSGYFGGAAPPSGTGPLLWSRDFGGPSAGDSVIPLGVAVDDLGEIVMTGYFQGAVDLGTGSLTSAGAADIFVAKYSSGGTPLWSRRIGSTQDERGKAIATDGSGNVFVTGFFRGTVDFGGGPVTSAPSSANVFLVKYAPTGAHLWSKRLSTASGMDEGTALAIDGGGNVLMGGILYQTSDFGGGPLTSAGGGDIFLAKFSSSSGAHMWSKRVGGTLDDSVSGLAVDGNGNLDVTGYFNGSVDFGGGVLRSAGGKDIFLAQYFSSGGAHIWSRRFGGSSDESAHGVAADGGGNVVITGNFASSGVDFGGGTLANSGGADIFVARYSSNGSHLWSRRFGGSLTLAENGYAVATDGWGNVVLTGTVVDTIDFGGGPLAGDGYYDIFVARFASSGSHLWSKRTGAGAGQGIATDSAGNVVVAGNFSGTSPVNFGGGNLSSTGGTDTFLVKFGP